VIVLRANDHDIGEFGLGEDFPVVGKFPKIGVGAFFAHHGTARRDRVGDGNHLVKVWQGGGNFQILISPFYEGRIIIRNSMEK
jgi:hypothetical protein